MAEVPALPEDPAGSRSVHVEQSEGDSPLRPDNSPGSAPLRVLRAPSRLSCSQALRVLRASVVPLVLLALVGGALGPLNTWDLPTYLGLVGIVLVYRAAVAGALWLGLVEALAVGALGLTLSLPY